MFTTLLTNSNPLQRRTWREMSVSRAEDETIRRYLVLRAMAGSVEVAVRRADAMTRLELSLGGAPVRAAVLSAAFPHRGDEL
jgi:hypothetical protein